MLRTARLRHLHLQRRPFAPTGAGPNGVQVWHRFDVRIAPGAGWSLQGVLVLSLTGLPPVIWSELSWAHHCFHGG